MSKEKQEQLPLLEEGMLQAMRALDSQISKELQRRSPLQLERSGVQKWEPISSRVERVASFVLSSLGEQQIGLDSLLVLSQAMAKSLQLAVEELGSGGLGELRASYCTKALESIRADAERGLRGLEASSAHFV